MPHFGQDLPPLLYCPRCPFCMETSDYHPHPQEGIHFRPQQLPPNRSNELPLQAPNGCPCQADDHLCHRQGPPIQGTEECPPNQGMLRTCLHFRICLKRRPTPHRPLCLAWLDIRNAFGSIPHAALSTTLSHMGFPPQLSSMIMNVYTGATTEVLTPTGKTLPIPIHSGLKQGCPLSAKQGCPLSAILFNLAIELIIRKCIASAAQSTRGSLRSIHHGLSLSILAYADDIVLLARDKRSLQHLLDAVSEAANSLNLEFRPDKCASLCLNKTAPRVQQEEFLVQDWPIPALAKEDHYRYLGVPIGLIPNISEIVQAIKMLSSNDPVVSTIATRELRQSVRFAAQADPTPSLCAAFLSNTPDRRLDTIRSRTGSLWTRTRRATKAVPVIFHLHDTAPPRISTCDYAEPVLAKDVCRFLHNVTRDSEAKTLCDLRDQGKVTRALHTDRFANGSSWLFTGLNLRFKDWRFIHQARLSLLPTNAVKSTWSDCDPTCHSPARPDIVIEQDNKVTIIDVCCPFENGEEALEEATARK